MDRTPPLFSYAFHVCFFPRLMRNRLSPSKGLTAGSTQEATFSSLTEQMVLLVLSVVFCLGGLGYAFHGGSLVAWLFVLVGGSGMLALLVQSVADQRGYKPSFDHFRFLTFIFLMLLGLAGGLGFSHLFSSRYLVRVLLGVAGGVIGYFIGILGGLWIQRLGWIGGMLDCLAGLGAVSLIIINIILLL